MTKPERVPGLGWQVGDQLFVGKYAREKAYRASLQSDRPTSATTTQTNNEITSPSTIASETETTAPPEGGLEGGPEEGDSSIYVIDE